MLEQRELECIEILSSSKDIVNGYYTCFYDDRSGFLHVSFKKLESNSTMKALLTLMGSYNWHIVGISDHCETGQYDYIKGLKNIKNHPMYSNNWSYVLFKCTENNKQVYHVSSITKLKPFLLSKLKEDVHKFGKDWDIKGTVYLRDINLQDKVDLCIYSLQFYMPFEYDKQLSLGLSNGSFKLYESNGLGT